MTTRRPRPGGTGRRAAGSRPGTTRRTTRTVSRPARTTPTVPLARTVQAATPRVRRRITARAAVVVGVLAMLGLSAALPLREYLAQRSAITALEQDQAAGKQRVTELKAEQQRLQDPTYLKALARERLHLVMPGETMYVLLDAPSPAADPAARTRALPWYSQLWGTVRAADAPSPAATAPSPAR